MGSSGEVVQDGAASLGSQERHGLGGVHGASPAEPDREVALAREEHLGLAVDVHVLGVGVHVIGDDDVNAALLEQFYCPVQDTGLLHGVLGSE